MRPIQRSGWGLGTSLAIKLSCTNYLNVHNDEISAYKI